MQQTKPSHVAQHRGEGSVLCPQRKVEETSSGHLRSPARYPSTSANQSSKAMVLSLGAADLRLRDGGYFGAAIYGDTFRLVPNHNNLLTPGESAVLPRGGKLLHHMSLGCRSWMDHHPPRDSSPSIHGSSTNGPCICEESAGATPIPQEQKAQCNACPVCRQSIEMCQSIEMVGH